MTRPARAVAALAASGLALATGCALLGAYDFDGYVAASSAPDGGDGGLDVDASDAGAGCSPDTANDAHNCGRCGHDCLGGACAFGTCQPTTVVELVKSCGPRSLYACGPNAIAVARASLYWADFSADGGIYEAPLDGGAVVPVASAQAWPFNMAADAKNLYWTISTEIRACPLDGCAAGPSVVASGFTYPSNVAPAGAALYWTETGTAGDGGLPGQLWLSEDGGAARRIVGAQAFPQGIAVDAAHVYWVDSGTPPTYADGSVMRADRDGANPTRLASAQADPQNVVVYGGALYWTNLGTTRQRFDDGAVMTCALDACTPTPIATNQRGAYGLAADATGIYWTAYYAGAVVRCSPPGPSCQSAVIAGEEDGPWPLALDDVSVLFTTFGQLDDPKGHPQRIRRVAK